MRLLGCAAGVAMGLIAATANAQHHGGGGGGAAQHATGTQGQGGGAQHSGATQRGGAGGSDTITVYDRTRNPAADAARSKAAAGDCKAALDDFDEALRRSIDPTLYRDRGSCHEKLGDVYPAIDDYRAYLSQSPNAPDYDKYRERLDDLIKAASQDLAPNLGRGGDFESEMRGGITDGSTPAARPKSNDDKDKDKDDNTDKEKPKPNDDRALSVIEYEEERDKVADKGALRKGKGFFLGAYLYPRYVANPYNFGFGQGVGARAGYSLNSWSSLFLELGYMAQLSGGDAERADGFTTMFAWEMRFPFDRWADNQFVFSVGGGYENLTNNTLGQAYASFVARGRAGWRHVFGPGFGLDILADGGFMGTAPISPPPGASSFGVGAFVGGIVAVDVGF
ncbi:MAG TPA: tetratricopeptide repeat protein [Polyangiaceae bacterium]|jgi:tetratricopeptide (TPR) repeat protein|nr:tetratricopeptide repeat protein [Polyangiaceae bacterium]